MQDVSVRGMKPRKTSNGTQADTKVLSSGGGTTKQKQASKVPAATVADRPTPRKQAAKGMPKPETLSSVLAYKSRVFEVYTDEVRERSGVVHKRDVVRHQGSVVILGTDDGANPADPDVVLIRQYRHAAGQYLLELPAGRIEPGEKPLAAAKREMSEETGFRAKRWKPLARYFASPGFLAESMQIFHAEGLTAGETNFDGDEDIDLMRMPLSEAMKLVATDKIHDGKTIIGLLMFSAMRNA